ncbi:MAG: hypothetical protein ACLUZ0_10460 [Coprococcus sp.]
MIAVKEIKAGIQIAEDLLTRQDIPQAHKVALTRIPKGKPVIRYAGTRNILGISTTVQCVTGVLNVAVKRIREELLSPAERPSKKGLIYAATPASDIVCGPCQLASGITLQVFMTGRGTPYGLAAAPVIKVCSRNEMKEMWQDLIDVNAGPVATGEAEISEIGTEIFNKILAVASGEDQSFAEKYKLHNDLCIFNPAPIT